VHGVSLTPPAGAIAEVPILDVTAFGASNGVQILTAAAIDAFGDSVPDILVDLESSDTLVARIDQFGSLIAVGVGQTTLRISTSAYGQQYSDSLRFTVGVSRVSAFVILSPTTPNETGHAWQLSGSDTARIAKGGVIRWENSGAVRTAITFDDPANVDSAATVFIGEYTGAGDISSFGAGTIRLQDDPFGFIRASRRSRAFPVAGTYRFTVTPDDPAAPQLHGVVLVCDESAGPCSW